MRPRLHGTDGIRGRIEPFDGDDMAALNALIEQRILSKRAMRIIGEATGLYLVDDVGDSPWSSSAGTAEMATPNSSMR